MAEQIIEATWEDLVRREDLRGRRLRVTVIDEGRPADVEPAPAGEDAWVARLRDWVRGHPPVGHFVDDSRDAIYGGTVDDPR